MGILSKLGISKSKSNDSEKKNSKVKGNGGEKKTTEKTSGKLKKVVNRVESEEAEIGPSPIDGAPSMDKVPLYIDMLAQSQLTSEDSAVRIMRHLFALSEHKNECCDFNRRALVHENNNKLLPVLLQFLQRCESGSQEQYLCLLVLNNISIPDENKRIIALNYGGVHLLSRVLCENPSCHLVAIILVNLTFADNDVRKELIRQDSTIQLIGALTFALQISMAPRENVEVVNKILPGDITTCSPNLLMKSINDGSLSSIAKVGYSRDPANQLFPETSRWVVCALKNLSRQPSDRSIIIAILDAPILPLILQIVTAQQMLPLREGESLGNVRTSSEESQSFREDSSASLDHNSPSPPRMISLSDSSDDLNAPYTWEANSIQDSALFLLLNISCLREARSKLMQLKAVQVLSSIADYGISSGDALRNGGRGCLKKTSEEKMVQSFQCLKARMVLACLVGGEGHFGQPRLNISSSELRLDDSAMLILPDEARQLVELFADTLHKRGKNGPGGYSSNTFSAKTVLQAIRCLLVTVSNQRTFMSTCGIKLSSLLLKSLARHCFEDDSIIDAKAAEYASFSLYLISNLGFLRPFLPKFYEDDDLVVKILTKYLFFEKTAPPGRHAAEQLLLRQPFLVYDGYIKSQESTVASDYEIDSDLLQKLNCFVVPPRTDGAKPLENIFDRAILKSRIPKKGEPETRRVSEFPSALYAVQQLSFGSTKIRHNGPIDDILIANNIASSADGLGTESYGYKWTWKDEATKKQPEMKPSTGFLAQDEPFSIFGFRCGM